MAYIQIVDDEAGFTSGMAEFLRLHDHQVVTANTLMAARELLGKRIPDVLLLDLMLPDGSGLEMFDALEKKRPAKIIIITGHTGVKSLIGGMAGDGVSYMKKPIEPREMLGMINAVAVESTSDADDDVVKTGLMLGDSDVMQAVVTKLRQVAPTPSTVFIQGESGTGKELAAEAVHRLSDRSGPFVPVNCGGLSKELISSQLFGHEKGSFTGAVKRHAGFFERANGGTLFLDEITEMPMELQTHLLRVLETGRFLRVGGETEIPTDARLIAATNRDPAEAVREGLLREDLYFRLQVFPIVLPPLRQRQGDVGLLVQHFLSTLNRENNTEKTFSEDALRQFSAHHWPGNVRELKHTVHRAFIMAEGDVVDALETFDDLHVEVEGLSVGRSIADVEKDLILATLKQYGGNKKAAADSLGVSLKTLYNRLNEYGDEAGG
ncbi:MAG: sigma-54 dependent transcriptional regulator [Woeseia sp.]